MKNFIVVFLLFLLLASDALAGTYAGLGTPASIDKTGFNASLFLSPQSFSEISGTNIILLGVRPAYAFEFVEFYLDLGVLAYSSSGSLSLSQVGGGIKWKILNESESFPAFALLFDVDGFSIGSNITVYSDNLYAIFSKKYGSFEPYLGLGYGLYLYNQKTLPQVSSTEYSIIAGLKNKINEKLSFIGDIGYASYGEAASGTRGGSKITTSFALCYAF